MPLRRINLFDLMDDAPVDAPADAVERVNELRATLQRASATSITSRMPRS